MPANKQTANVNNLHRAISKTDTKTVANLCISVLFGFIYKGTHTGGNRDERQAFDTVGP